MATGGKTPVAEADGCSSSMRPEIDSIARIAVTLPIMRRDNDPSARRGFSRAHAFAMISGPMPAGSPIVMPSLGPDMNASNRSIVIIF
jgi:hypothetical protein